MSKPKFATHGKEWTMHSPTQSMYEVASEMINTELFLIMIEKMNLMPLLKEDEEYTVFIPVDSFIIKMFKDLQKLYEHPIIVQQVVMNHFVKGKHLFQGSLEKTTTLKTIQGSEINVENNAGILNLNGHVKLLDMNLECRNGIVHIVDKFLVPSPYIFNLPDERFLEIQ
jgi:uncharacterized surface protein with fasciclin (FAS1) repeats